MPRRPLASCATVIGMRLDRGVALVALVFVAVSGGGACRPPEPKPDRDVPVPVAAQPTPSRPSPIYLVLRLRERRLHMMRDDSAVPIASFPIAVGREGHETATGQFHIEEKVVYPDYDRIDPTDPSRILERVPPGPANPLGERWMGIAHGEGWSVGIHGTPRPELLGQAVSGGCIRMRNADVIRIYDQVEIGTRVIVEP